MITVNFKIIILSIICIRAVTGIYIFKKMIYNLIDFILIFLIKVIQVYLTLHITDCITKY
jgi:hypothetical protein